MVLSSYSNFGTDFDNVNSEPIHQTKPLQHQLAAGDHHQHLEYYCDAFELPSASLDPCIDLSNNFLHPENYNPLLLPYFSSPYDPLISFSPENEIIPFENLSSYSCPKRQKLLEDHYYCSDNFVPASFDGVALNSCPVPQNQSMHQINSEGNVGNCKKISERCVSVQSIAARERRRKITEETQELGKLVPGGKKMNTAEMLQSAFKYIMYLQAQVGILEIMDSFPENDQKASCKEIMQVVTSPKVQEKLYMEEKCLVPENVVLSLTTISEAPLSHELSRL